MIGPILIANRGEIAVRIARTVRELGLRSAAVFEPGEEAAPHVDACDVATAVDSYLDVLAILDAAAACGARAVHPGYGFLSENARFGRAVVDAGLTWIGPPPEAIALMADKASAKALAQASGVPVVPGLDLVDPPLDDIRDFGAESGFPIMIKAVAGGGGKGMRVVRAADDIGPAVGAARREATAAFGDGRVLVERYIDRPRHLEVQVLADSHGECLHIGERECSLQRRHQKVVEEAPSPVVDAELRERMGQAAISLARACGYCGAGTVEFIADTAASEFYFLEMNTRLQVEHPVTELVYGLDLVELQLRLAFGEPLQIRPADVTPRGHAIEARIYAEDPANGFLPSAGAVHRYREPAGAGIRVDSGIREGIEVITSYDPLLAKVIAHGRDRVEAMRRLDRALGDLVVLGVCTNASFTRELLRREDVAAGETDTGLLERALDEIRADRPEDLEPAGAITAFLADTAHLTTPAGPWCRRYDGSVAMRVTDDEVVRGDRVWRWSAPEVSESEIRVALDGVSRRYSVARVSAGSLWIGREGHQVELRDESTTSRRPAPLPGSLDAPMPGTVLLVEVENGERVSAGDLLLVIESMKMELSITAPAEGTVDGLAVRPGDRVARGEPLLVVRS
jgi:acetyl-CoA/propionyl-CoA carboxylase biotin carboxyl carrier protein